LLGGIPDPPTVKKKSILDGPHHEISTRLRRDTTRLLRITGISRADVSLLSQGPKNPVSLVPLKT
jgi:hypothetical protein